MNKNDPGVPRANDNDISYTLYSSGKQVRTSAGFLVVPILLGFHAPQGFSV